MPGWLRGCRLRPCWFEPTFQKHSGKLCSGFQIHVEDGAYHHGEFRPWRLIAGAFKCIRRLRGEYPLWRDFPVRIRAHASRHRSHQRQRAAARVGGRSGGDAGRSRPHRLARRSGLGRAARGHPAVSLIGGQAHDLARQMSVQASSELFARRCSCTDVSIGRSMRRTASASAFSKHSLAGARCVERRADTPGLMPHTLRAAFLSLR